jgi:hypothetical protein
MEGRKIEMKNEKIVKCNTKQNTRFQTNLKKQNSTISLPVKREV